MPRSRGSSTRSGSNASASIADVGAGTGISVGAVPAARVHRHRGRAQPRDARGGDRAPRSRSAVPRGRCDRRGDDASRSERRRRRRRAGFPLARSRRLPCRVQADPEAAGRRRDLLERAASRRVRVRRGVRDAASRVRDRLPDRPARERRRTSSSRRFSGERSSVASSTTCRCSIAKGFARGCFRLRTFPSAGHESYEPMLAALAALFRGAPTGRQGRDGVRAADVRFAARRLVQVSLRRVPHRDARREVLLPALRSPCASVVSSANSSLGNPGFRRASRTIGGVSVT